MMVPSDRAASQPLAWVYRSQPVELAPQNASGVGATILQLSVALTVHTGVVSSARHRANAQQ